MRQSRTIKSMNVNLNGRAYRLSLIDPLSHYLATPPSNRSVNDATIKHSYWWKDVRKTKTPIKDTENIDEQTCRSLCQRGNKNLECTQESYRSMIEPFIITFWVELHGRLYHKRLSRSFNDCEAVVEKLYKEFEDKEEKLIAVKCDTFMDYRHKYDLFGRPRGDIWWSKL